MPVFDATERQVDGVREWTRKNGYFVDATQLGPPESLGIIDREPILIVTKPAIINDNVTHPSTVFTSNRIAERMRIDGLHLEIAASEENVLDLSPQKIQA